MIEIPQLKGKTIASAHVTDYREVTVTLDDGSTLIFAGGEKYTGCGDYDPTLYVELLSKDGSLLVDLDTDEEKDKEWKEQQRR